ncbi:uncharacterized protein LOC126671844 [Mercurialis annua]|uniref:uncharacterized protein LOC126671844 n=1 Tax=Mercurialis annua TaxID=3986 RepID=UPI00215F948A|nr:uncharacterized protein LOC126671844 [Mercurialis annua]
MVLGSVTTSISNRWILLDFLWKSLPIRLICVYASNCPRERAEFWPNILEQIVAERMCILIGDFNEVLSPTEIFNCSSFSSSMQLFADFINSSNLIESPLQDRLFTWQNSTSKSRIDRCFISADILVEWPNCFLSALPRNYSDHTPLLFRSAVNTDWGPKPFRSINAWWEHSDFESFVANSWEHISVTVQGDLVNRLRALRSLIKDWNINVFGNLNNKLDDIHHSIHLLEASADFSNLSDVDRDGLAFLHSESYRVSKQLESLWHQKSRGNL